MFCVASYLSCTFGYDFKKDNEKIICCVNKYLFSSIFGADLTFGTYRYKSIV